MLNANAEAVDDSPIAIKATFPPRVRARFRIRSHMRSPLISSTKILATATLAMMLQGCAYMARPAPDPAQVITEETIRQANKKPLPIRRIFQTKQMMLDSLPVGTILPYYNSRQLRLPENWRYANGDIVDDPESPLVGQALPDLLDDLFLMGATEDAGLTGGSNQLEPDGNHSHLARSSTAGTHNHGGRTGLEEDNGRVLELQEDGETRVRIVDQAHRHTLSNDGGHVHVISMDEAGLHDHGGDNRPNWFGVLYIIKIK